MNKFLLHILLSICTVSSLVASCQNKTGFLKGDKAFTRYLEKELGTLSYSKDTTSYYFTLVLVIFDSSGRLKDIKYGAKENLEVNKFISERLMNTKAMWNPKLSKNKNIIIPIELFKPDYEPERNKKIINYDFFRYFTDAFDAVVTRPIIILRFDTQYRKIQN